MRKNKFSKLLSMFLALTMTLSLASCGSAQSSTEQKENSGAVIEQETEEQPAKEPSEEETEETQEPVLEKVDINLAALKGPTALGMLDLLEKNDNGEAANNYNVTLAVHRMKSSARSFRVIWTSQQYQQTLPPPCTIKHRAA